jgi:hypothetical protein
MTKRSYGRTRSGKPITEELLEELAKQAEEGFDVDKLIRRRGGRPPMGSAPATVESVRLDPELSQALRERADDEGRTNSDVIRDALRRYLNAS